MEKHKLTTKELKEITDREFTHGLLYAVQELVLDKQRDELAKDIVINSGISLDEFLVCQKESGYMDDTMKEFLYRTFKDRD